MSISIPFLHIKDSKIAFVDIDLDEYRQDKDFFKGDSYMGEVLVARHADLAEGGRKVVSVNGVEVGIFLVGGDVYAWLNHCPHQGGPVCQGRLMKGVEERLDDDKKSLGIHYKDGSLNIICPWHGFEFDVRTGRYAGAGALKLKAIPVSVRDGGVYVRL